MAGNQNGPIPTQLTLLSNLQELQPGAKVRFLGCVTGYSTKTAILYLEHNHPPGNSLKACVDIGLLVNSIGAIETRVGEWVNVMGYLIPGNDAKSMAAECSEIYVQAIVLWPAGPLNLKGYEKSLDLIMDGEESAS